VRPGSFGSEGRVGQPDPVVSEPHQREPYQYESYQSEPGQPASYQSEPYRSEPYQSDAGQAGAQAPQPAPGLGGLQLRGQEQRGADLRSLDLGGQDLGGRDLRGRDLRGRGPRGRAPHVGEPRKPRTRVRTGVFAFLLSAGLLGLAVAAVGIAHQLLPRQFTPSQQHLIANWEMEGRWLSLPAARIFPASVPYVVPGELLGTPKDLDLTARLLDIKEDKTCAAAIAGKAAARIFSEHGCTAALRATYVDATGSMVATVAIAVLPDSAAASEVVSGLPGSAGSAATSAYSAPAVVHTLQVPRTPAASFYDHQRQLSQAIPAGPYVIFSSAGFSDGRPKVHVGRDGYLHQEMLSLVAGLVQSADKVLGARTPLPACPGAPGC
jgi:hypothetical protein